MSTWEILEGDCREVLRGLPEGSVHTCVTSPPYFGLRNYGHDDQIGLEPTPDEFTEALVAVFREVRRVLRNDGTVWVNLGTSFAGTAVESEEMVMRDDLTPAERKYVLEELARYAS